MEDKDKVILVFYINVDRLKTEDIYDYLCEARASFASRLDDSIIPFIIPVFEENTHVDCINPKIVGEDKYVDIKKRLESATKALDGFMERKQ